MGLPTRIKDKKRRPGAELRIIPFVVMRSIPGVRGQSPRKRLKPAESRQPGDDTDQDRLVDQINDQAVLSRPGQHTQGRAGVGRT